MSHIHRRRVRRVSHRSIDHARADEVIAGSGVVCRSHMDGGGGGNGDHGGRGIARRESE